MTKRVPIRRKDGAIVAHALVDAADYESASRFTWRLDGCGYAVRGERRDGRFNNVYLHRELLGLPCPKGDDPRQVDHRNRNPLDNRRANLRIATQAQNVQNISAVAVTSGYRGVGFDKARGMWRARVQCGGKHHFLGYFPSEEEAAEVARAYRVQHMPFSEEAA